MRRMATVVWLFVALFAPAALVRADGCGFQLGFAALASSIPRQLGSCVDDEQHDPATGDAVQHTTRGLLVWRKSDNGTAFTDGAQTWVVGGRAGWRVARTISGSRGRRTRKVSRPRTIPRRL